MASNAQYYVPPVFYEEDIQDILSVEPEGYTSIVHTKVVENRIKVLKRLNFASFDEMIEFVRDLHNKEYLYDDCHIAYGIRNKIGEPSMQENFQFLNRDAYLASKDVLGLS
jgi:hypothetical protein